MLTLREAATRIGVHPSTVRRWEQAGLVTPLRTPGGHRRFIPDEVEQLLSRATTTRTAAGGQP
jgi:putative resolvase